MYLYANAHNLPVKICICAQKYISSRHKLNDVALLRAKIFLLHFVYFFIFFPLLIFHFPFFLNKNIYLFVYKRSALLAATKVVFFSLTQSKKLLCCCENVKWNFLLRNKVISCLRHIAAEIKLAK